VRVAGELTTKWTEYADNNAEGEPVILEPSVYKYGDDNYELLRPQWDRFIERLCAADYTLILGYSLPEADSQAGLKSRSPFRLTPNANGFWSTRVMKPAVVTADYSERLPGTPLKVGDPRPS